MRRRDVSAALRGSRADRVEIWAGLLAALATAKAFRGRVAGARAGRWPDRRRLNSNYFTCREKRLD